MTTLLKPGIDKILYVFYKRKNEKIHLRELARVTKMYGQSITRYLKYLEKNKILKSEKEANLKQYSLLQNNQVYSILAMFDIEKTQKLPILRKNAISTYIKTLPYPPIFAIVFGSTAKETYKDDSDIDIVIVTDKKIDTSKAEKETDALNAMKISTFQITFQDFIKELKLKEDKVIQSALETGYPVLNQIYYYEVLHNERV
ncbi:MAG: nucleotidyltransferase domain-containing protein [Candidatus Woesearchaeota archaeon]|jgi:predicted nucleotidyltransferase